MTPMPAYLSAYAWLMPCKTAIRWTRQALDRTNARIDQMNPIDHLEEMQSAKKARDALQKALKELQAIQQIHP
jgi:small-conductance mechanosensitive channel